MGGSTLCMQQLLTCALDTAAQLTYEAPLSQSSETLIFPIDEKKIHDAIALSSLGNGRIWKGGVTLLSCTWAHLDIGAVPCRAHIALFVETHMRAPELKKNCASRAPEAQ